MPGGSAGPTGPTIAGDGTTLLHHPRRWRPCPTVAGMALGPGDPLPDVPLVAPSGDTVALRGFAGEHALLIFLRHLA
jgi:hypothetical protein